jgi:integrase
MRETGLTLFVKYGRYYLSYTDDNGRRRQKSTSCKTKSEALKVLGDFKRFIRESKKSSLTPFSVFKEEFLDYAETNYSRHTKYLYEKAMAHFIRINGDLALEKINARHYDNYKVTRLREPVQGKISKKVKIKRTMNPITVNIELRSLRAAMSTAVRWQFIEKNPFERLGLISITRSTPAFLTTENVHTLLNATERPWLRDMIIFAINTGLRRGELVSLRWSDIDTEHRIARIINRVDFTTKSGEERIIVLNDAAIAVINRCVHSKKHEYLFSREEGMRVMGDWLTAAFKSAARKAGLPEGIHLHSTRHSFASLLVGSGTSIYTVSKLLGHSSAKTSEIYSHLLPQHLHNEVAKISIGAAVVPNQN